MGRAACFVLCYVSLALGLFLPLAGPAAILPRAASYPPPHRPSHPHSPTLYQAAPPATATLSVKAHGAKGDGRSNDTAAVQATIDACAALPRAPGVPCVVLVPAGDYVVGALELANNLELRLEGSLLASLVLSDWHAGPRGNKSALVSATDVQNLTISGPRRTAPGVVRRGSGLPLVTGEPDAGGGSIHGRGPQRWYGLCQGYGPGSNKVLHGDECPHGALLDITNSTNVHVHGIQMTWPPAWHAHLNNCTGVLVENVGVLSPSIEKRYQWHSTGGMGISNPSGVLFHVRNMTVAQGDDNWEVTGSYAAPTHNVLIEDSFQGTGDGGNDHGHVHHVTYRNVK